MKKGFIVLLAIFLMLIPLGSAFAYVGDGGLLEGKIMFSGDGTNTGTNRPEATDNNLSTYWELQGQNVNTGVQDHLVYNPTETFSIRGIYVKSDKTHVNKDLTVWIRYNNGTVQNISKAIAGGNGYYDFGTTYTNVDFVWVESVYGNANIYEFEIYETTVPNAVSVQHTEIKDLITVDMNPAVSLSWTIPTTNPDFTGSKIYRNGTFLTTLNNTTNVYNDTTAIDGETYTYKVTATYSDGFETSGVSSTITPVTPPDTVAPLEPTAIQYSPTKDSILVTWTDPADPDLKQINIYKDGVLVGNSIKGTGSYTITNLQSETAYSIKITAVDLSGNESVGVVQSITTNSDVDLTAPTAPTGIEVTNYSNGALVQWNKNLEPDLQGYNIFIDGVKDNATPITQTSYQIFGLEVGKTYSITVSAVDTSNNESLPSVAVSSVPSADNMPILKMGYELKDVADGVAGWFSNMWLIVAFAVAIPLSFYIAMRTKLLFVG